MSGDVHEAREALGARMRDIRKDAGLSGTQLARMAGWHPSKVSKIEYGKQAPSDDDIRIWCLHCKAKNEVPDLIATLRNVEAAYVEWKRIAGIKRRQQQLHDVERVTKLTRSFEPVLIPGLLQTHDYMKALLSKVSQFYGIEEPLDDGIAARLQRQEILYRGNHRFNFLLAEQVLYTTVGSDDIMIGQLDRILNAMTLPNVVVSIIPFMSMYEVPTTNFVMFDRKVAYVETITAELTITQPRELVLYEKAFQTLAKQAAVGNGARELIRKAIQSRSV
ncbi:helix-turn-helix transcriptional regulator [Nocardia terpenica]|uniref:helix-turn-helix domain-containing protein n=1 Tax=Nocardia terpenica TaxID=455432 RepID=UPI0018940BD6|nr:helix-turn-helix transcriptional regulator [Nocardia terpenica]MBF6062482.1 helix-turn-helix transcriptional regulator [Nocardia terpenica]MBF6104570.1 helix-turn-helix transcriptional regulator [Nocardia terpenica]MBF6109575.1 helix-turn-helix transcriptional regulator [Nocardia terpenica]MBF6119880.1 helix-turn-helix transcriptional regulator [Nocardia terpenica]MBF6152291.1 helix-turn-helix transcriptional regulator [Nocardia terpenica]